MKFNKRPSLTVMAAALALSCAAAGTAQAAAQIVINNVNAPGIGFNDTTPAAPVGGNAGTTLGQQRLIAFKYAADIWGATLTSPVPIVIDAKFSALTCTDTGAVLGSAGATTVFRDFPGAPKTGTWYSYALTNKLYGGDATGGAFAQINANFNVNLGNPGCLTGTPFYLGLDNNHGAAVDFVTVLLHEMGHGVGFQTFTSGLSGNQLGASQTSPGYPSAWDHYLLDNTTNMLWKSMTPAERRASALKPNGLSWTGPRVTAAAPNVLSAAPELRIIGAGAQTAGGTYSIGEADFGPAIDGKTTGQIMPVVDQPNGTGLACTPLSAENAAAVNHNIALISRGACGFAVKVKNAQNAGAIGVIVADNAAGPVAGMGGFDPSITIPAVRITQADGALIAASLTKRNGNMSGTVGKFELSKTRLAGTDSMQRVTMYTPNPYQSGSSVSHYTTAAKRNQLMEPAINADLSHSPTLPLDLTFELLKDIGW